MPNCAKLCRTKCRTASNCAKPNAELHQTAPNQMPTAPNCANCWPTPTIQKLKGQLCQPPKKLPNYAQLPQPPKSSTTELRWIPKSSTAALRLILEIVKTMSYEDLGVIFQILQICLLIFCQKTNKKSDQNTNSSNLIRWILNFSAANVFYLLPF